MAGDGDSTYNGYKLSYLDPQSPPGPFRGFLGPPIKLSFGDEKPLLEKEKLNIYLRVKHNNHAFKQGPYKVLDEQTLVAKLGKDSTTSKTKATETKFKFSKIFGPETSQNTLFQDLCLPSLRSFIKGDNCLLFTYGATNSGKTFTIQGTSENPGIIPRTISVLFNSIEGKVSQSFKYKPDKVVDVVWLDEKMQQDELKFKKSILGCNLPRAQNSRLYSSKSTLTQMSEDSLDVRDSASCSSVISTEFTSTAFREMKRSLDNVTVDLQDESNMIYSIWLSFAEIYNEQIYDLLETTQKGQKRKPLSLGETDQKDTYIKGLHQVCVFSGDEAFQVFQFGQHNLKTAPTNVNHVSSRSHSIFIIKLVKRLNTDNATFANVSTFSLVDLAGAERAKKTCNIGERMRESQSINTSLLVLGKCLEVIRQNQADFMKRMIPFRESKLTRLFQRALRGQDILTLIVNVNLDSSLYEETVSVLKFSALAKEIVFDTFMAPKACKLRSSRFSRYLSETSVQEKHGSRVENISRIEELLGVIDSLQKEASELKQKNAKLELKIREEMYNTFSDMLQQVQNNHRNAIKESEERIEEMYEWRINRIQGYYEHKLEEFKEKKTKRCKTASDDETDTEDSIFMEETTEELLQKINVLDCKLSAIQEQRDNYKQTQDQLQVTCSKLMFENAALKTELDCARRVAKAAQSRSNSDSHENDPLVAELEIQLEDLKKALKEKDEELKARSDLIAEAERDYLTHFKEHEDECEKIQDLEEQLASKEEEIEHLKSKLELCQIKIQEQAVALDQQDEEKAGNDRYRLVCEARDEYKFSAANYEAICKKLEKENQELKGNILNKSVDKTEVKVLEAQVASLEDQLKLNKEALQVANTKITELETALETARNKSEDQESMEKELHLLQKEIKDLIQSKKDLAEELAAKNKENENLKQELKISEAGLTQEQNNAKDLQKYLCAENEKLTLRLATLSRDLEKKDIECQKLDEDNQILEGMIKNQEAEMESFKSNRDAQFKIYDDLLKQRQEEVEMHKREVQRFQELFVKNPTPNKNEHLGQISKLKDELMLQKDELQRYKVESSRGTRKTKVQDENDPSLSNDLSQHMDMPLPPLPLLSGTDSKSAGDKPRNRRKKLFMQPDEGETSPVMYVKRGTRSKRV